MNSPRSQHSRGISRRRFLQTGALGAAALSASLPSTWGAPALLFSHKPNVLLLMTDQQGLDTISALGCPHTQTPAIDSLVRRGTSFLQSYTANPLCSPARSSIFTGRTPSEAGVPTNGMPIRDGIANIGRWLGQAGYQSVYVGKWHLPITYSATIDGFQVIPAGMGGQGELGDAAVSRACEGFLRNRSKERHFCMVASLLQPHDVCEFITMHEAGIEELPFAGIADQLPPLPANFHFDPREPALVAKQHQKWSALTWRYYLWNYYRMVEMADAQIGRILRALEDSGEADNTLVVFTADHGEGRGRHQMVTKNYLYDEAAKVPLVISHPGHAAEGASDAQHLVSGLDVVPTVCDYVGIKPPPRQRGRSLRPFVDGRAADGAEFIASEVEVTGRMIRTPQYKYITYAGDPVEQLFDMTADPGETHNLATDTKHSGALGDHRKMLRQWTAQLDVAPVSRQSEKSLKVLRKHKA